MPAHASAIGPASEPGSALLRVRDVSLLACDLLLRAEDGRLSSTGAAAAAWSSAAALPAALRQSSFRVLYGALEAISSDALGVAAAARAGAAAGGAGSGAHVLALSTLPLSAALPGALLAVPVADLLVLPAHVPPHAAMSAIATAFRAYSALLTRVHPRFLGLPAGRGGGGSGGGGGGGDTSLLIIDGASGGGRAAAELAQALGVGRILLHARSAAELAALHAQSCRVPAGGAAVELLPLAPAGGAGLAASVARATGGLGADIVLEAGEAAELSGLPQALLHPSLRLRGSDGAAPIRREAGGAGPAASVAVLEESALARCLAPHGQLLTARAGAALELDRPLAELLRAQNAGLHLLCDAAWLLAPRWHGVLLHTLQRLLQDVECGALHAPPPQLVHCPAAGADAAAAAAAAAAVHDAMARLLAALLAHEEPAEGVAVARCGSGGGGGDDGGAWGAVVILTSGGE